MFKVFAAIALALTLMLGTAACGEPAQEEYVGVCVDPNTQERLEDDACEDGDSDFLAYAVLWYMLASGNHAYPAVGDSVSGSHWKHKRPKYAVVKTGLPAKGGKSVKTYYVKKYPSSSVGSSTKSSTKSGTTKSGGGFKSGGSSGFKSGGGFKR